MGKIQDFSVVRVNLSNQKITREKIKGEKVQKYLGGRGLASKILYDEIDPEIDPLSPENKLMLLVC